MKKLLAIDGNSILNRAFFGIRPLTTADGLPTNAIYGMLNIILSHIEAEKPDYAAVAFDLKEPTFRHKKYDGYKANRHGMPDELAAQLPYAKDCCRALGLHVIEQPGFEADDVLGTLAKMASDAGDMALIVTGDRDSFQLIGENVNILLASNSGTLVFDRAAFNEKYGVEPEVFVDVKALMGDSSDNIPGVAGIGEKTALKLISEYGTLDSLYEKYADSSLTAGVKTKLENGKDMAYLSQFLARIDTAVPLGKTLDDIAYNGADADTLIPLLTRLEFTAMIKKLSLGAKSAESDEYTDLDRLCSLSDGVFGVDMKDGAVFVSDGEKCYRVPFEAGDVKEFFASGRTLVLFDCKAWAHTLKGVGGDLSCKFFDIMLAAYVLDSQGRCHSVAEISSAYLSKMLDEEKQCTAKRIFELYSALEERLDDAEKALLYDVEQPLALCLCNMERSGFRVDLEGLAGYSLMLTERASVLEGEIYDLAGGDFNINSPKQLGQVLFERLELPSFKKTKSGYSTNAEVLEKLRPYHPIIDKILEYRRLVKLNSTYAVGLTAAADENGSVHTTFNQTVTATGRLSSTEPNLQNIPIRTELGRELRRFFIPSGEDRVIIDADYSQIELRLLAAISGDETMTKAFRDGVDIHTLTASQVFGVFPEMVTGEQRKRAKAVNFGIVYGIGDFSLAADIHVTRKQAAEYIKNYLATYPGIDKYLKDTVALAKEQGFVTTLMGRKRYIPELKSGKKTLAAFGERVAMNSPIQGTAADVIKVAMINTEKALAEAGIDAHLILQVHDELLIDSAVSCAEEAREILRREMEHAWECAVPLTVEIGTGSTWFDAKE